MTDNKLRAAMAQIREGLLAIPNGASDSAVVEVFRSVKAKPQMLGEAFWELDTRPAQFWGYQQWHPKLRCCRNNPKYGEHLFALFA